MKYHSFWRRVAAAILDFLLLLPLDALGVVIIFSKGECTLGVYAGLVALSLAIHLLYHVLMTALRGQTLGKMALGVRVNRVTGQSMDLRSSLLRQLPMAVLGLGSAALTIFWCATHDRVDLLTLMTIPPWFFLARFIWAVASAITIACNERRRTIHDYVAGTVVLVRKYETVDA